MNQPRDQERLLADVLAEESAAGFREALLSETLGLVRRRHRVRQAWRAASALVLIAGLGVMVWRILPPTAVAPGTAGRGYEVVVSQPLPPAAVVLSQPFAADRIVASVRNAEVVQTSPSRGIVREIDDGELLALLVFINPADEEELFRN